MVKNSNSENFIVNASEKEIKFTLKAFKHEFTGVAKCHENDIFNEEIGKKIARCRGILKFLDFQILSTTHIINEMRDMLSSFEASNQGVTGPLEITFGPYNTRTFSRHMQEIIQERKVMLKKLENVRKALNAVLNQNQTNE